MRAGNLIKKGVVILLICHIKAGAYHIDNSLKMSSIALALAARTVGDRILHVAGAVKKRIHRLLRKIAKRRMNVKAVLFADRLH